MPDFSPEIMGSGEKLLLVEDDYSTREAMKTLLEDSNYKVLVAANGQEALSIYELEGETIAMIISDMVMPEMGGVELYKTLVEKQPEVKMLFITGHPIIEDDQSMPETGNVHWLQKPFSVGVFSEAVYSFLNE